MPPLSPALLTRLDPAFPLLWRDADTLQLGMDGDVTVSASADWVELLLSRMRTGFRRSAFDVIAHALGAPRAEARQLLARVDRYLVDEAPRSSDAWIEAIDLTDGRAAHRMREALSDEGITIRDRPSQGDVAIVLVRGQAAAVQFARLLGDDRTHLPVAFESGRVTIGPLVVPGRSPCLSCRDGHERDRDPAWPRLHSQLIGRDPGPLRAAMVAGSAALVATLLRGDDQAGDVVTLTADGSRASHSVTFHEECRCREQSFPSQRESAMVRVLHARPTATTSDPAFARRA